MLPTMLMRYHDAHRTIALATLDSCSCSFIDAHVNEEMCQSFSNSIGHVGDDAPQA